MDKEEETDVATWVVDQYAMLVETRYLNKRAVWPVVTGADVKVARLLDHQVLVFIHTGNTGARITMYVDDVPSQIAAVASIDKSNIEAVRRRLEMHFRLKKDDCVFLLKIENDRQVSLPKSELESALRKHEKAMSLAPMRVFLSHKGADKPLVRDFDRTLRLVGFNTWLDEDALTAGAHLERGLSNGFSASCAAVFFITKNYKD